MLWFLETGVRVMMFTKRRCGLIAAGALSAALLGVKTSQAAPLSGTNLTAAAGAETLAQTVHWRGRHYRYYRPYYYDYYPRPYYRPYYYRPYAYYGFTSPYYYPRPRYYRYWW
jgi:hypothetical protein